MCNRIRDRAFFPGFLLLSGWLWLGFTLPVAGQMPAEQQAKMLLDSGKRAYNEKNYPFARDRFREFVQRFANLRDADQARFGLALCLLEGPERDFDRALEALQPLLGQKAFPDYAAAHYRAGVARRGQGLKALETPATQPQAKTRFEEAARHFATAAEAYLDAARSAASGSVGALADREAGQKARCEQAEMLLRAGQQRLAGEAVAPFAADKDWQNSRSLSQGLYCLGVARFLQDDYAGAGKALGRKDILENDIFGTHARYLLARVYHLNQRQNEREEARIAYQDVLKDHEAGKKKALERLNQPADPETRQRLERLARGPDPEHVVKARFFLGMLQVEDGRHGEALDHFKAFLASNPPKAVAAEAQLQTGVCLVEMKQADDAIRVLQPFVDANPDLADQALYHLARAQLAKADEKKPETFRPALETFRRAAERAGQRAAGNPPDPRARPRRGEILMDLGEACLRAGFPRDAAAPFTTVIQDKLLPDREDEATLQLAVAQQLD
ncbi:MAG: tetratricopeptide repeat protein, partial [Gemmataceae bacterium]